MFTDIVGNAPILRLLSHAISHPAHGYLFSGPSGVGKRLIAERFTMGLLDLPSESESSALVAHPDFVRLQREEGAQQIVVKQVRDLLSRMRMTSARGGKKVAIIEQADRLNEEAANALLKAVEEPDAHSVYLFLAERPESLPATLRSRLVSLRFERVSMDEMREWISKSTDAFKGVSDQDLEQILRSARGIPSHALDWALHPAERSADVREATSVMQSLLSASVGEQIAVLESLHKRVESHEDTEAEWRAVLTEMMDAFGSLCVQDPRRAVAVGMGLCHAWKLAGTSLSPRLALEWSAVSPYAMANRISIASFLSSSYL